MKLRNKIVALFLTVACAFGLAVAGNAQKVDAANFGAILPDNADAIATFTFGANGSAAHVDGNAYSGTKTYTDGDYSLAISSMAKVYGPAYDAKGNSAIKLGTSSVVGSFKFTAPEDADYVAIHAAKYKSNTSKVTVNGSTYTLSSASNNGAYDMIVVDTTTTKAINFSTASGGVRCMINTIEYYAVTVSEDVTDLERVEAAAEALKIETLIYDDINLPSQGLNDTTITWESSDEDTLFSDGVINLRDVEDTPVTLTATISYGEASVEKEFEVNVLGEETIVANALASLNITKKINGSIKLPTTAAEVASITWESDDEEILTKAGKLVARPAQDTIVTLTATAKVGGTTATKEIEVTVKGLDRTIVTNPVAGTKYLLMVSQENNVKDNFVNGSMANTYYFATTTNAAQAKTVELVEVEGGFHLIMGTKYINIKASGSHINAVYENTPTSVWTFNKEYNTLTTVLSGKTYCLNSYGTYDTVSPSELKSATFICHLVELTEEETVKAMGVKVGFQVGTKDESKALRLVAAFDFAAEEVANFDKEISFRVTHNDVADERVVTTLYSSVNPMNDEEVLEDGYYAVLTYVNVPAGEYLVEVLVNGVVAATVVATVA